MSRPVDVAAFTARLSLRTNPFGLSASCFGATAIEVTQFADDALSRRYRQGD
jgi:hypothetical protein